MRDASVRVAIVVIAVLVAGAVALITFAIGRPEPPSFVPTPAGEVPRDATGAAVVTVDASSPDEWRFLDFEHGIIAGLATGSDWDLALRRFHIIANGGPGFPGHAGILDFGPVAFDSVTSAPAAGYIPTRLTGRDSTNAAIERWYRYGFTSHLLTPLGHVYAVRDADGRHYVRLEILGYYCPGARPGCVTVRWAEVPAE